jgi:hypothetical protein
MQTPKLKKAKEGLPVKKKKKENRRREREKEGESV